MPLATQRPAAFWWMAPVSREMTEHLGHEEGVAVGLTVDRLGQTKAERVEALTGYRFEQ